jgi:hypothetical protein
VPDTLTWNWIWNWENVAISIRVLSPGDDGEVIQSNSVAANLADTLQTIVGSLRPTVPVVVPGWSGAPQPAGPPAPLEQEPAPAPESAATEPPPAEPAPAPLVAPVQAVTEPTVAQPAADTRPILPPSSRLLRGQLRRAPPVAATTAWPGPPAVASATIARAESPTASRTGAVGGASRPSKLPPAGPLDVGGLAATFGASGHGSGWSASGIAILLGFLLFSAPGFSRWLRVGLERQPRPLAPGRPERPG